MKKGNKVVYSFHHVYYHDNLKIEHIMSRTRKGKQHVFILHDKGCDPLPSGNDLLKTYVLDDANSAHEPINKNLRTRVLDPHHLEMVWRLDYNEKEIKHDQDIPTPMPHL